MNGAEVTSKHLVTVGDGDDNIFCYLWLGFFFFHAQQQAPHFFPSCLIYQEVTPASKFAENLNNIL